MRQAFKAHSFAYLLAASCIAGCSFAPDVTNSHALPDEDAWPSLLPANTVAGLMSQLGDRPTEVAAQTEALSADAEALRARAAGLSSPILTKAERQRLQEATAGR